MQEMLLYTAEMKLEMVVSMAEKREKVEDLLKQLALDGCRKVRIGSNMQRGISGTTLCQTQLFSNPSWCCCMPKALHLGFAANVALLAPLKKLVATCRAASQALCFGSHNCFHPRSGAAACWKPFTWILQEMWHCLHPCRSWLCSGSHVTCVLRVRGSRG